MQIIENLILFAVLFYKVFNREKYFRACTRVGIRIQLNQYRGFTLLEVFYGFESPENDMHNKIVIA